VSNHHDEYSTVTIVGLGLIGGSFALALRRAGYDGEILGVSRPEALEEAKRLGAVNEGFPYDELATAAARSDLIVLATPISRIVELIEALGAAGDSLRPGTVITDVGSTKGAILSAAERCLPEGVSFIGGHPLAGSEERGMGAADPLLFENAYWVLCAGAGVAKECVDGLGAFVSRTGARVLVLPPTEHDRVAAAISHVPQLLAVALVNSLDDLDANREHAHMLAAGGFRDMTRIASSPYAMWRDIYATNPDSVRAMLKGLVQRLEKLTHELDDEHLDAAFTAAKDARDHIPRDTKGFLTRLWDLHVVVPDKPGMIADISGHLYGKGINIKDMEVLKVREGETGSVRLSFATAEIANEALHELERAGYRARLRG